MVSVIFKVFLRHFILAKLATSSIRVKWRKLTCHKMAYHQNYHRSRQQFQANHLSINGSGRIDVYCFFFCSRNTPYDIYTVNGQVGKNWCLLFFSCSRSKPYDIYTVNGLNLFSINGLGRIAVYFFIAVAVSPMTSTQWMVCREDSICVGLPKRSIPQTLKTTVLLLYASQEATATGLTATAYLERRGCSIDCRCSEDAIVVIVY